MDLAILVFANDTFLYHKGVFYLEPLLIVVFYEKIK